ncbi:MAG: AraC family transcriptional regulator [Flavobacteriales bacterium]|nr:AraC family transcriptional regulator [Flavobacteriales bacterium]
MLLLFQRPVGPIAHAVEHITFHQGYRPPHAREVFVPDGGVELVIDLSDAPKERWHDEHGDRFDSHRRGWVSGMRTSRIVIGTGSGAPMLVLRLRPGTLPVLTRLPASELNDQVVDLDLLLGARFTTARDRLGEALDVHGAQGVVDSAEAILAPLFPLQHGSDDRVRIALCALRERNGTGTVSSISRDLGCSQKHLNDLFHRHFGLGPKRYGTLLRFQSLLQRLESTTGPDWAQLALEHGFYDQSHMTNVFRTMTGHTPSGYMANRGPFLNWLPVVEAR